ncbi:uncharacterized protein LOC134744118 isoform X1 [Cydia strobilella]|uniref:uncharacterized protein LOC134744118 isoform X1 n=1 Tax=Cydia strobilella TaxID=1100964 RepID=UPI00300713F6
MICKFKKVLWILLYTLTVQGSLCLRNVHVIVPDAAERGSKVRMQCLYDLEQEVLYSVKWYRGDREFCRYQPRDVPPLKVFRIPGIEVERDETDAKQLVITAATRTAGGRYTCEVSADAPSFQTAQVHTHMYVVDLPQADPQLIGIKQRYRAGMTLKAECFSKNAMPAANLSFFINSEPAQSQHVWHRVDVSDNGKLMTAYSTIQFVVQRHHFVNERIKVRCTAIIYSIYLRSVEKSAEEERIRTTTTSGPEVRQAKIYSVHRQPKPNASPTVMSSSSSARIVPLVTLLLPTVLR